MSFSKNKHVKRILCGIAVFFIAFHFICSTIYLSNGKYTPLIVNKLVGKYMLTFFHQDWRLFAPNPPNCHIQWYVRYISNETSSDWIDLGAVLRKKHVSNRIGSSGFAYRAYQAMGRNLIEAYLQCSQINIPDVETCFFAKKVVRKAIAFSLLHQPKKNINTSINQLQFKYHCTNFTIKHGEFIVKEIAEQYKFPLINLSNE